MKQYTLDVPKTRDPFVNVKLVPAGLDPQTGEERFWASTWNGIDGSTGALVTPSGKNTIYHFDPQNEEFGFYGAAYAGNDTMWMSCFTDRLYEFNFKTGKTVKYLTGVPSGLTNSGLTYDAPSGKVFYSAYYQGDLKQKGLVFDTKTKQVTKVYDHIAVSNTQLRNSIRNLDGSYTYLQVVPDLQLFTWDPKDDRIEILTEPMKIGFEENFHNYVAAISRADGAIYLPFFGWYDPLKKGFVDGKRPQLDMCWFGSDEAYAYGALSHKLGNSAVYRWHLETGEVELLAEIPDVMRYAFALSKSGKIVCVNLYGFLYSLDKRTGAIETAVRLDSDARGSIDCVHRIDDERLLCTPFITQRFYEINTRTNTAVDLGRACGGVGEVLKTCELNGKIYMASYTKGQMCVFDPKKTAHFPENPTIACEPPAPAMRPVAMCDDGTSIYYSCSHEYGALGCMMVKYTEGCAATICDDPTPGHMIRSLVCDASTGRLLAGTSYHADCTSAAPIDNRCKVVSLDKSTLHMIAETYVQTEFPQAAVLGMLEEGRYLVAATDLFSDYANGADFFELDAKTLSLKPFSLPKEIDVRQLRRVCSPQIMGKFVFVGKESIETWDLCKGVQLFKTPQTVDFYHAMLSKGALYLVTNEKIHVFEDIGC